MVYFVEHFSILKSKLAGKMDDLWLLDNSLLTVDLEERIDKVWSAIGMLEQADGAKKFNLLFEVVKYIIVLPHSNAEDERIFSTVKKNKTTFRPNLSAVV